MLPVVQSVTACGTYMHVNIETLKVDSDALLGRDALLSEANCIHLLMINSVIN